MGKIIRLTLELPNSVVSVMEDGQAKLLQEEQNYAVKNGRPLLMLL